MDQLEAQLTTALQAKQVLRQTLETVYSKDLQRLRAAAPNLGFSYELHWLSGQWGDRIMQWDSDDEVLPSIHCPYPRKNRRIPLALLQKLEEFFSGTNEKTLQ